MREARFRFYGGLNDLLPRAGGREFTHSFLGTPSVKDRIEALGVPHTEVELVLVNGEPVDFSYLLRDGDRISVYPRFESLDLGPLGRSRPETPADCRFVLDGHLGKLARYLRMVGFDTSYRNDRHDAELARISAEERRILLTKDRGLLKRSAVVLGYFIRETRARQQLVEVLRRFDLQGRIAPFERCMLCNATLVRARPEDLAGLLPPGARGRQDSLYDCPGCGRVYWAGSHHEQMERFIEEVRAELAR
jgi:hypothetical protein